jgi:hypothetical protein
MGGIYRVEAGIEAGHKRVLDRFDQRRSPSFDSPEFAAELLAVARCVFGANARHLNY